MTIEKLFLLLLTTLLCGGCATIMDGRTQEVTFVSSPEGATVSVDGRIMGVTPLTVRLDRRTHQSALFQKNGYQVYPQRLTSITNGWLWGNLPVFPLMIVDFASGAVNELFPSQYSIILERDEGLGGTLLLEQQKAQAKELLRNQYREIFAELSRQGGPVLTNFMDLLHIPKVNQLDAIDRMKTLAYLYRDVPTYADRTVDDLMDHGYARYKIGSSLNNNQ